MQNPFMQEAIREAEAAYRMGEVPVGAVVVRGGEIIARGHNLCKSEKNPFLHAEMVALTAACKAADSASLSDCDLYVTLEPCAMCCGAICHAGVRNVYFGAYDTKGGFAVSNEALFSKEGMLHHVTCYCGIMEEECSKLLQAFFREVRLPE